MHPIQIAIEKLAKAVHSLKKNISNQTAETKQTEIGAVKFSRIEFNNGYPFSPKEIPFKKPFPNDKVMVQIIPVFAAITNTTHAFNVYEVTRTGFKLRMNVKNAANKGILKELYYQATYIGETSDEIGIL